MRKKVTLGMIGTVLMVIWFCGLGTLDSNAAENFVDLSGSTYEFTEDEDYPISEATPIGSTSNKGFGSFIISGDMTEMSSVDGSPAYDVKNGNIKMSYSFNTNKLNLDETEWNVYKDGDDEIDGFELKEDINLGTMIVQTSLDGKKWVTDNEFTDVLTNPSSVGSNFATTKDIQLINGCYYRIILVYEQRRKVDSTDIMFVSFDNYEYRRCADVYRFYAVNKKEKDSSTTPNDVPRKELGEKINTGKDNGFSGNEVIDKDDAHYGWNLGTFVVNGYSREVSNSDGNPVFLKNLGDRVTLWFNLQQDIEKLNGNEKLSIAEDDRGYDQYFEVPETYFKHGTLIIRFTDHEGKKTDPIIYTDYLAANTRTGAYTKVELFEEGDYEVSLDYEIKDARGTFNSYPNYKISFKFSIRNGNCMVFPFDTVSGAELNDQSITSNGFKLDMAKSRYLTIDVKRSVIKKSGNTYVEDVRFNRPAKDEDSYLDEGMYTFTVNNLYTSESVTKTIYVGESPVYLALAKNKLTVDEINQRLATGEEIADDGTLLLPEPTATPTPEPTATPKPTTEPEKAIESDAEPTLTGSSKNDAVSEKTTSDEKKQETDKDVTSSDADKTVQEPDKNNNNDNKKSEEKSENEETGSSAWIFVLIGVVLAGAGVFGYRFIQKSKNKGDGTVSIVATKEDVDAIVNAGNANPMDSKKAEADCHDNEGEAEGGEKK